MTAESRSDLEGEAQGSRRQVRHPACRRHSKVAAGRRHRNLRQRAVPDLEARPGAEEQRRAAAGRAERAQGAHRGRLRSRGHADRRFVVGDHFQRHRSALQGRTIFPAASSAASTASSACSAATPRIGSPRSMSAQDDPSGDFDKLFPILFFLLIVFVCWYLIHNAGGGGSSGGGTARAAARSSFPMAARAGAAAAFRRRIWRRLRWWRVRRWRRLVRRRRRLGRLVMRIAQTIGRRPSALCLGACVCFGARFPGADRPSGRSGQCHQSQIPAAISRRSRRGSRTNRAHSSSSPR